MSGEIERRESVNLDLDPFFHVPTKRRFCAVAAIDEHSIVVVGGLDEDGNYLATVELYDGLTNTWEKLPDMPNALYGGAVVFINNHLYVLGGRIGTNENTSAMEVMDMTDMTSLTWKQGDERLPPMNYERRGCAAAVVDNCIYVFGGYSFDQERGWVYLRAAERYDIEKGRWDEILPMSSERGWFAAAAVGKKIYVIGGIHESVEMDLGPNVLNSGEVFDVHSGRWTTDMDTGMMERRQMCVAVVVNNFIVVIGGKDEKGEVLTSAETYDAAKRKWKKIVPGTMKTETRDGFGAAIVGKCQVVIVGGLGSAAITGEVILERYLEKLLPATRVGDKRPPRLLGDHATGSDLLGIDAEARALADTLAFHNLAPPFVVGLMGGWGAGKSFTFNLIKNRWIEIQEMDLRREADQEVFPFVGHLYVVKFDAWTFAKGNLWSSLMYHILVGLNDQLHFESLLREYGEKNGEEDILLKGVSTLKIMEELSHDEFAYLENILVNDTNLIHKFQSKNGEISKALVEAVNEKHTSDRKDLEDLRIQYDEKEKDMKTSRAWKHVLEKANTKSKLEVELETAYNRYMSKKKKDGDKDEKQPDSVQELLHDLTALHKFWIAVKTTKLSPLGWLVFLGSIFAAVVIPAIISFTNLLGYISALIPIASTVILSTRSFLKQLMPIKEAFNEAREADLDLEVGDLEENERLLELKSEIDSIQQRVWLVQGKSVDSLVQERVESQEYEKDLGVVHKAQIDLQRLSDALTSKRSKKIFPRGHPRIVLFVDDLDRCPPRKVVECLEAVQLLVKTDLFVVVMAIDARFVTLSLEKQYSDILRAHSDPSGLDYLEKIIQLPYRVPPINRENAMESYLKGQMKVSEKRWSLRPPRRKTQLPVHINESTLNATAKDGDVNGNELPNKPGGKPIQEKKVVKETTPKSGWDRLKRKMSERKKDEAPTLANVVQQSQPAASRPERNERTAPKPLNRSSPSGRTLKLIPNEELEFTEDEVQMLKRSCLASNVSPRSVKRIVNVYKVMKIIWHHRFVAGQETTQEERDACLLILSMCASRSKNMRNGMCEVFHLLEIKKVDLKTYDGKLEELIIELLGNVILKPCEDMVRELLSEVKWGSFEKDFWLARSFSFVGEYMDASDAKTQSVLESMSSEATQSFLESMSNLNSTGGRTRIIDSMLEDSFTFNGSSVPSRRPVRGSSNGYSARSRVVTP